MTFSSVAKKLPVFRFPCRDGQGSAGSARHIDLIVRHRTGIGIFRFFQRREGFAFGAGPMSGNISKLGFARGLRELCLMRFAKSHGRAARDVITWAEILALPILVLEFLQMREPAFFFRRRAPSSQANFIARSKLRGAPMPFA